MSTTATTSRLDKRLMAPACPSHASEPEVLTRSWRPLTDTCRACDAGRDAAPPPSLVGEVCHLVGEQDGDAALLARGTYGAGGGDDLEVPDHPRSAAHLDADVLVHREAGAFDVALVPVLGEDSVVVEEGDARVVHRP